MIPSTPPHTPSPRAATILALALSCLGAAACGCAGSPRIVSLALQDAEGSPVAAAHVRAIALRTNDLPLPVSLRNLALLDQALVSGVTDERGVARLPLRGASSYLIEVTGTPFDELSESGPWRWKLAPHARSLTPLPEGAGSPTRGEMVSLRLVGARP